MIHPPTKANINNVKINIGAVKINQIGQKWSHMIERISTIAKINTIKNKNGIPASIERALTVFDRSEERTKGFVT